MANIRSIDFKNKSFSEANHSTIQSFDDFQRDFFNSLGYQIQSGRQSDKVSRIQSLSPQVTRASNPNILNKPIRSPSEQSNDRIIENRLKIISSSSQIFQQQIKRNAQQDCIEFIDKGGQNGKIEEKLQAKSQLNISEQNGTEARIGQIQTYQLLMNQYNQICNGPQNDEFELLRNKTNQMVEKITILIFQIFEEKYSIIKRHVQTIVKYLRSQKQLTQENMKTIIRCLVPAFDPQNHKFQITILQKIFTTWNFLLVKSKENLQISSGLERSNQTQISLKNQDKLKPKGLSGNQKVNERNPDCYFNISMRPNTTTNHQQRRSLNLDLSLNQLRKDISSKQFLTQKQASTLEKAKSVSLFVQAESKETKQIQYSNIHKNQNKKLNFIDNGRYSLDQFHTQTPDKRINQEKIGNKSIGRLMDTPNGKISPVKSNNQVNQILFQRGWKECTFKPQISPQRRTDLKKTINLVKGFEKVTMRLKQGYAQHLIKKHQLEHIPVGQNYDQLRMKLPNPPSFIDRDQKPNNANSNQNPTNYQSIRQRRTGDQQIISQTELKEFLISKKNEINSR